MTNRIPLVMVNGQIQQLQAGDQISVAIAQLDTRILANGESSATIVFGTPVYVSAAAAVKRGQANAAATAGVIGLVAETSIANGATGNVGVGGVLTASATALWDAVTGQTGGLTAGSVYYLDPANVGKITATPPSTVGQLVVPIGRALSTVDMEIAVGPSVLL